MGRQRHLCPLRGPSSDRGDPSCLQTKQPTVKPLIPTQRSQCYDWTIARHVAVSTEEQHLLKHRRGRGSPEAVPAALRPEDALDGDGSAKGWSDGGGPVFRRGHGSVHGDQLGPLHDLQSVSWGWG